MRLSSDSEVAHFERGRAPAERLVADADIEPTPTDLLRLCPAPEQFRVCGDAPGAGCRVRADAPGTDREA